jgi:hypothetical protein
MRWPLTFLDAGLTSAFVLGLFIYWFGLANRHVIFLYEHATVGIPTAQPFDPMTSSRYWMAGLVAGGVVTVLYGIGSWLRGRIAARRGTHFTPAAWWHVWLVSLIPLAVGIPVITMTLNEPTLPPRLAVKCGMAALAGLAVALGSGQWAAERPVALIWLAADGVGLMPPLLLLKVVALPGRGLSISSSAAWLVAVGSVGISAAWLFGMSFLRVWRRREMPGAGRLYLAGLGLSYVLMPLVHHLLATPSNYRYISTASNFFAFNGGLQVIVMLVALGLAVGVARGRVWLRTRRSIQATATGRCSDP